MSNTEFKTGNSRSLGNMNKILRFYLLFKQFMRHILCEHNQGSCVIIDIDDTRLSINQCDNCGYIDAKLSKKEKGE